MRGAARTSVYPKTTLKGDHGLGIKQAAGIQFRDSGLSAIQPLHATLQNVQGILEYVVVRGVSSGLVENCEGHWSWQCAERGSVLTN